MKKSTICSAVAGAVIAVTIVVSLIFFCQANLRKASTRTAKALLSGSRIIYSTISAFFMIVILKYYMFGQVAAVFVHYTMPMGHSSSMTVIDI